MKRGSFFLLSVLLFGISYSQPCSSLRYQDTIFHQVTVTKGIYFGTATPYSLLAQPQDLYLDFYEPTGDTLTKRPLIVFEFGGGYVIGWRSEPDIPQFCEYFAKCGYTVASIDYRLGLNAVDTNSTIRAYYRGVQDERSALRFLCQRANQFRFDTSLVILTGTSAGCFCAFANAFTTDAERPASTYGSLLEPSDLGCLDCSGNNDFAQHIPKIKAIVNQWGAILDTNYIDAFENVPVISFHGDQDVLVPYVYGYPFQLPVFPNVYGSVPIHQRLTSLGIMNEFHPLIGYGHEPELLAPNLNDTIYNYSRVFLYKVLKPNTGPISGPLAVCKSKWAVYSVPNTVGSKYCWQLNGNGSIVQNNGHSMAVLWNDTGMVSVSVKELNVILAEGEELTFETMVVPDVEANFGYIANELSLTLSNWSSGATHYNWSFSDDSTSQVVNPVKIYAGGGTYLITLAADNGVCADTFSTTLAIDSCPVAGFTYQITNRNGFFYARPTNTTSYTWYFGDGDSASVNNPNVVHLYQQDGNYEVLLRVQNQIGCSQTDTAMVHLSTTSIASYGNEEKEAIQFHQTSNDMEIRVALNEAMNWELYDVSGRKIGAQSFTGFAEVSLSSLQKGIYLLRVRHATTQVIRKIVVH